ncbi:MAG: response regulator [Methylacidiphilales bacterium]|nr:response regulator [Candidatus Methylacidiphilales bacterium]
MNILIENLISLNCVENLIIDGELTILEVSSAVANFADIPEEVQQGRDVRISFPELVGTEDIIEAIIKGEEQNFQIQGVSRSKDKNYPLYIDIYVVKNIKNHNSTNELIVFILDSTSRMLLEQSLIQNINEANLLLRNLTASKQYIDTIITSMPDALLLTTSSGKIKKINPAAQALLEYDEDELIGQSIANIIKDWVDNKLDNPDSHQTKPDINQINQQIETVCHTKNGKIISVAISYSILQTEVGHFQGYVYILRDITERKQAELAKQEFLAMITHEVRTPITSVSGMASLLLNTKLNHEQKEFVKTIYTSGESLLKIINDFLDFSKIESGKLDLEIKPFNLRSCIHEVLYLLAPKAREKGIKLLFIDTPEIPTQIEGDITRLRQILINLLNNAIKFTDIGSIEISVATLQKKTQNYSNSYELKFAVKDTGIGISKENLERLFKAFSQVNSSITRQYGGTGLGLAICKKLVELMDGKIWVESELGVGSTFYFAIATSTPVIQEISENVASDVEIDAEMAKKHPLRILLVEDNVINQRMIQLMLQRMGYQPNVANNGLEALAILHSQTYDVVLMDVQMPEMDGLTATQRICQEWTADIRPWIVALTASAMWGERDRCLASGMDNYLSKPIRIKELMEVLKKCQPLIVNENNFNQNIKDKQMKELENLAAIESPIHPASLYEILQMASFNPSVDALEFLFETIDYYLEETPRVLQDIHTYISQNNDQALRRAAHTLASTSATLGAVNLATFCTELEVMIVNEELDKFTEQISKIESEYQLVQVALENERKNMLATF